MKILFLFLSCMMLPVFAQTPSSFFQKIKGFWKQVPAFEESGAQGEENYFEFAPDGQFKISVNMGGPQKPVLMLAGYGELKPLKQNTTDVVTAEIMLNDEYSTNIVALRQERLVIYAIDEKTGNTFEKIVMERSARP